LLLQLYDAEAFVKGSNDMNVLVASRQASCNILLTGAATVGFGAGAGSGPGSKQAKTKVLMGLEGESSLCIDLDAAGDGITTGHDFQFLWDIKASPTITVLAPNNNSLLKMNFGEAAFSINSQVGSWWALLHLAPVTGSTVVQQHDAAQ
jgi:hypothetical protein